MPDDFTRDAAENRPGGLAAAVDHATLGKLAGLIGESKVRQLLALLADTLRGQFDGPATTPEGRAAARAQAHAAIAGAGMLGFGDFVAACRTLEAAPDDDTFGPTLVGFKQAAEAVAATACALSRREAPLVPREEPELPPPVAP